MIRNSVRKELASTCKKFVFTFYDANAQFVASPRKSLREKCLFSEFFWSVFSRIRTEYGEIIRISPYSVRMQINTDKKKLRIWTLFTH